MALHSIPMNGKNIELMVHAIDKITPYKNNPKDHPVIQIKSIKKSMDQFGFKQPIVIDKDNVIVAGHARFEAAKALKYKEILCVSAADLTADEIKAYRILDNELAKQGSTNTDLLLSEIADLPDFDFSEFNLDLPTIEILNEGLCDEDEVPEIAPEPITKLGDQWLLGNHRLKCADSTCLEAVDRLMNGAKPNLMITDPPYGVNYEAGWRAKAKNRKSTEREDNSNLQNDDQADWYDAYSLFQGNVAYVWHASAFTDVVMDGLRRCGFDIKQQIIWNKNVHALSRSDYHWKHEPCWYAVRSGADHSWSGSRKEMTIWDVKSIIFEKDKTAHPTQKPVELYLIPIENHTKANDTIYDPFSGSGSLIIACEKTGRKALSMELDPKYCDVIIKRWQKFSGKDAILEFNGKTFNELV